MQHATNMTNPFFRKAQPVWLTGRETEMNLTIGFRTLLPDDPSVTLHIAASTRYRAWLNGRFLGWGPTRGPHGFYRVDEWDLSNKLNKDVNLLAIEVAGYNVNSFELLDQPAFIQAEALSGDRVLAATGRDFDALIPMERVQKAARYSFQRGFSEVYRLQKDSDSWRTDPNASIQPELLQCQEEKRLLSHHVPLPKFNVKYPVAYVSHGCLAPIEPDKLYTDRSLTNICAEFKGYLPEELEETPFWDIQRLGSVDAVLDGAQYSKEEHFYLSPDTWRILDFGVNSTGFPGLRISCETPARLILAFDEILSDGDVNDKRLGCINVVYYHLEPGRYALETFEPYTMRFLKLHAIGGALDVQEVYLREHACPDADKAQFRCNDSQINQIFEAARETYRQNAVDIFTDCPSRERAGWLCDSFFTARTAMDLSGHTRIEDNFLQNFLLPDKFPFLPDGMLPMCYPSDHNDGVFIPNWAMWFVVELEEYRVRGGDTNLIAALKPRVMALMDYFLPFENSDGLLEKLEKWVFVEWSPANEFVQDVNYPTNMLYHSALQAVASLYDDVSFAEKAKRLKNCILEQSFDGEFFVDNAIRKGDTLRVTRNRSETCQYYAFFFDIASPDTHPALWCLMRDEFGSVRVQTGAYPDIHASNAFIGYYLRLELLSRYGEKARILADIKGYFAYMAELTGTLWENAGSYASCNHGFASHVAHVLLRDILGVQVYPLEKRVRFSRPNLPMEWCEGEIPIGDSMITCRWSAISGIELTAAPEGWMVEM
jgi:alpha-L-rhamnosidase